LSGAKSVGGDSHVLFDPAGIMLNVDPESI